MGSGLPDTFEDERIQEAGSIVKDNSAFDKPPGNREVAGGAV